MSVSTNGVNGYVNGSHVPEGAMGVQETITGRQAFLRLLRANGIKVLFGNPGTTELPVMDELAREEGGKDSVRYIMALMEAAVLAMADGYAQATGSIASVNLHGGSRHFRAAMMSGRSCRGRPDWTPS